MFRTELRMLARSIFRIGCTDELLNTSTLQLLLLYEPTPQNLRERFTLRDAKVTLNKDLYKSYRETRSSLGLSIESEDVWGSYLDWDAPRTQTARQWCTLSFHWTYVIIGKDGRIEGTATHLERLSVDPAWYELFGPPGMRAPRHDWKAELMVAMAGPDRPLEHMLYDDLRCEDEEGIRRIQKVLEEADDNVEILGLGRRKDLKKIIAKLNLMNQE
ncbi:hypothetical protein P7C70_g7275, partial [Phenoliferia sp. Uapishka_3]